MSPPDPRLPYYRQKKSDLVGRISIGILPHADIPSAKCTRQNSRRTALTLPLAVVVFLLCSQLAFSMDIAEVHSPDFPQVSAPRLFFGYALSGVHYNSVNRLPL